MLNMTFFCISVIFKSRNNSKREYNPWIGVALTTMSTLLGLVITSKLLTSTPMYIQEYILITLSLILVNFYICMNSHMLLKYRAHRYYTYEYYYAYFHYWGDILFYFWVDFFTKYLPGDKKKMKKKNRKNKKNANK